VIAWWNRLTVKLAAIIVLAVLLPLAVFGVVAVRTSRQALWQETGRANLQLAQLAVKELEAEVNGVQQSLTVVLDRDAFAAATYDEQADILESLLWHLPYVKIISVLDTSGQEQLKFSRRVFAPSELRSRHDHPAFAQALQGTPSLSPDASLDGEDPTVSAAFPIWDAAGDHVIGVLMADILLRDLLDSVVQSRVGNSGYLFVVDKEGHLLAHPDRSLSVTHSDYSQHPHVRHFLTDEDTDETHIMVTETGVEVLTVGARSPKLGWIVIVEQPTSEALAATNQLRQHLGVTLMIIIATAGVLAAFIAIHLTRPLRALEKGAEQIGRGALSHRINASSRDEIGRVANAFNDMAERLETSRTSLLHSRSLLLLLNQAAIVVQRARSDAEVFQAVGDQALQLGYQALILLLTDAGQHLEVAYCTISPELLRLSPDDETPIEGMLLPYDPQGPVACVLDSRDPQYMPNVAESVARILPPDSRGHAERVAATLGTLHSIRAPLVLGTRPLGVLDLAGADLTEDALPAVMAFANQTAIALENARLYRRAQSQAELLEARVTERTQELNDARLAALNMMQDAERARRQAETAERAVRRQAEDLARSNRDLEEFAYVTSHDLQEPLRSIVGFLQLLERRYADKLDDDAREYIKRSIDATVRLKDRIQALLQYARVGRQGQAFEPVSMAEVVESAQVDLRERIEAHEATITSDALPTIWADRAQMEQLLRNLLSNALKFRGDALPHIHISAQHLAIENGWRFAVRDNGIGIEAKYAEKVFELFERLHPLTRYPGTGIGLAICKRIVERHGGRIWVEAEAGSGSTFFFTLPDRAGRGNQYGINIQTD
jgi:signal transduction histidine kinase/HAMP domain-containing protein